MNADNERATAHAETTTSCDKRKPDSKSLSMHEGVEVWDDCCSCEAEPYWLDAFARSGPD